MNLFKKDQKLRLRAVQLISRNGSALLRRGCLEFKISGDGVASILEMMLKLWQASEFTVEEVRQAFPESKHHIIMAILESLAKRDILVLAAETKSNQVTESSEDIFYWNLGENRQAILERLNKKAILIIGVNTISMEMLIALREAGITNLVLADDPLLRNEIWYEDQERLKTEWHRQDVVCIDAKSIAWSDQGRFGCVVAASDFGFTLQLEEWNRVCLEKKIDFLPVVLSGMIGYVGPLVFPGETACYACARSRINSNECDPSLNKLLDEKAFEGQRTVAFHSIAAKLTAQIATMELIKFYSHVPLLRQLGLLIEINLLGSSMQARKVMKLPRCPICSPLIYRPSVNINRPWSKSEG